MVALKFDLKSQPGRIVDDYSAFNVVCDLCGNAIGIRKSNYQLYNYNYNLTLFEERYNVLSFISGNCGLLYST